MFVVFVFSSIDIRGHPGKACDKIHRIIEDSPAAEAGLREGDVIMAIGGRPVSSPDQLYSMFKQEGQEYDLSIQRGGERLQVRLKLRRLA